MNWLGTLVLFLSAAFIIWWIITQARKQSDELKEGWKKHKKKNVIY